VLYVFVDKMRNSQLHFITSEKCWSNADIVLVAHPIVQP